MGIPIIVGGRVTGIDPFKIAQMAGASALSVIVPFWLVAMMDGWRGIKGNLTHTPSWSPA